MLERSKWQKELTVFGRLVNTIVLTGNVNDQYPVIDEQEQRMLGFCSLELYLARICRDLGYRAVVFYDPVRGFHSLPGSEQNVDVIGLIEEILSEAGGDCQNGEDKAPSLCRVGSEEVSLLPGSMEEAAQVVHMVLTKSGTAVAVVMSFSSRMAARPDDLDISERMTFLYLQEGAARARKNPAEGRQEAGFSGREMLQNQLFLIADKINDLPAWYYLSHPGLKNIDIPKPDYQMRRQIISGYAMSFPGYGNAREEERAQFLDAFTGAAEGFTTQDIARVFRIARWNGLDISGIDKAILLYKHGVQDNPWLKLDAERLRRARRQISKRVIGQERVVKAAVDIVKRAAMGMSGLQHSGSSSKPRGILFLAGPTGTGKTELAKALTELIFLDEHNMIRFDMSEYRQEQSDQRLLGAPPGYVGYEAGGQLTNAVREHPFSVLLFDEIEKAHPTVLDKFLQVLEDGRITDGKGETVYFQDCLIIFTSNLGMAVPSPDHPGVRIPNVSYERDRDYQTVWDKVSEGVKHYFTEELGRPELLNRIGNNILVFDFIREESLKPILAKQIGNISGTLWADKHIRLELTEQAEEDLYRMALSDLPKGQGGRGIGNMIEEMLINPLAGYLFDQGIAKDATVIVKHLFKRDGAAEIEAERA